MSLEACNTLFLCAFIDVQLYWFWKSPSQESENRSQRYTLYFSFKWNWKFGKWRVNLPMHSRICSRSRSFHECYFCLYPTCLKYLAKWQVITRIICHFHVRKASDNCCCDNFFDIVAAQLCFILYMQILTCACQIRGAHNLMSWLNFFDFFLLIKSGSPI